MDLSAILAPPSAWGHAPTWAPFAALTLGPFLATGDAEAHADALENLAALGRFARVVIGCCDCLDLHGGEQVRPACIEVMRIAADGLTRSTPNSVARASVALVMQADPLSIAEMVREDDYVAQDAERLWMFCQEALRLIGGEPIKRAA